MNSIQDQFKAFTETKAFLQKIALNEGHIFDQDTETQALKLMNTLPSYWEADNMFRLYAEWQVRDLKHAPEPVEYSTTEGGWIYWDETWTTPSQTFTTKKEADDACTAYAKSLNG